MAQRENLNKQVNSHKAASSPLAEKPGQHKGAPTTWKVAQNIQRSPVRWKTDLGKPEADSNAEPAVVELVEWPPDRLVRQLTAVIYAESTTQGPGGEDDGEKLAIGATFINRAYYANWRPQGRKSSCFNSGFGNGTIWGAITAPNRQGSLAYGRVRWNQLVDREDHFRIQNVLNEMLRSNSDRLHYNLSVQAATLLIHISKKSSLISITLLGDRIPVGFNQSSSESISPRRMERLEKLGSHYFYAFKPGNECEEAPVKRSGPPDSP